MKIINPFQMNNWPIKKFLIFVILIQLSVLIMFGLDLINYNIPVLRQIIFLIYLIFLPGILILRILKFRSKDSIENLLYSVGLSISLLMFTGFLMNFTYPMFGILNPISYYNLVITFSIIMGLLTIVSYLRDRNYSGNILVNIKLVKIKQQLALILVVFLSIIGTYLLNQFNFNILNVALIVIIGTIALLVGFNKISKILYPLTVFVISISLLYLTSLISPYVWGNDIQIEYYFASVVYNNSLWNFLIGNNVNATLSIVMLGPILSDMLKMNLDWTFKIIYPLIYSLVPLGIYKIAKSQTNENIAFFSAFFFMATFSFYSEMLSLARQEIAELFFMLIILLIITDNMRKLNKSILIIVFGISLIISHYSLSYVFVFMIGISLLIHPIYERLTNRHLIFNENKVINSTLILLFLIFTASWYMYVSNSSAFNALVNIVGNISSNIFKDFLDPNTTQGLDIILTNLQPMHQVTKYLNIITIFSITLGFLTTLINQRIKFKTEYLMLTLVNSNKFKTEYLTLSMVAFIICILSILIPNFSSQLQTSRLYYITLLLLSPFCIIGFISIFNIIKRIFRLFNQNIQNKFSFRSISVFFAVFLLFNVGIIYEITGEKENSASLISFDKNYDFIVFNDMEIAGAEWLALTPDTKKTRYADAYRFALLLKFYNMANNANGGLLEPNSDVRNSYIYLGSYNSLQNKIFVNYQYIDVKNITGTKNKIYDAGGSTVYL